MILAACGDSTEPAETDVNELDEAEATEETDETAATDDGELPEIGLQALSGGHSSVILKVIEEQDFDDKNGFKGEFHYIDADAANQNFILGHTEISFDLDVANAAIMRSQGHDTVVFGPGLNMNNSILVRKDLDYESPEDLIGKKVGHFGEDSSTTTSLSVMLKEIYDIDIFNDFELVTAGAPALVELLDKGEIDAMFNFDPHNGTALVRGHRILFSAMDAWEEAKGGPLWLTNIGASEEWLKENQEIAYGVRDAYEDAHDWLLENFDEFANEPYKSLIGKEDPDDIAKNIERSKELPLVTKEWGEDELERAEEFIDLMAEQERLIKENPGGTVVILEELFGE